MRIAVQMDPIEKMVVNHDTSLMLMVEAQARGHELWWFTPNDLFYETGMVKARARRVTVSLEEGNHYKTEEEAIRAVDDFDVVLVRQDPPFDMAYVTNTYLLELTKALVINPPRGMRNISEKMSILQFPELTPKTWVGRDVEALVAFARAVRSSGAESAVHDGRRGRDQAQRERSRFPRQGAAHSLMQQGREPILAQEFLPAVSAAATSACLC